MGDTTLKHTALFVLMKWEIIPIFQNEKKVGFHL